MNNCALLIKGCLPCLSVISLLTFKLNVFNFYLATTHLQYAIYMLSDKVEHNFPQRHLSKVTKNLHINIKNIYHPQKVGSIVNNQCKYR